MKTLYRLTLALLIFQSYGLYAQMTKDSSAYASGNISVGLVVKKPKKSNEFYKDVLGMVETGRLSIDRELAENQD